MYNTLQLKEFIICFVSEILKDKDSTAILDIPKVHEVTTEYNSFLRERD